ncbi:ScyD/ScyE family protein [Blastococcus capsensis]|uniref:ScyD/ScyE family protein n=1 Tax=Blastococcus capsensis TaxID=1564163 RepID=UPI00253FB302|nr:ScyD/ScyE family protein [Blastococcus capsensis]MDK3256566.1 ScyD/ScyE family protein [Blastococcus capsensis]
MRCSRTAVGAAAVTALMTVSPAMANAQGGEDGDGGPITTVVGGLDGPRQLSDYTGDRLVVAESDSGEVSSVDPRRGRVETLLTGLGNAQGVDYQDGRLYVAVGETFGPPVEGVPSQVLLEAKPNGKIVRSFDLLAYELEHNPDGQQQFVEGTEEPVETLSNPFSVLVQDKRILVSDAGANAVLSIDRSSGEISTFFVPPVITDVPGCETAPNNPGTVGCDPVPTEIAEGPRDHIYVGTLGAEVPGAGRVYVLDRHGEVVRVIEDLTSVTGVAVDHGKVYVSNVIANAPMNPDEPPEGFDPATIGEITEILPNGERTTIQVTMPTGLEVEDGQLHASAWSVAGFLGMPSAGEVQRISDRAFSTP